LILREGFSAFPKPYYAAYPGGVGMRRPNIIVILILAPLLFSSTLFSQENKRYTQKVDYIEGTIMSSNDGIFKLLDGTIWYTNLPVYILPITDIIIILESKNLGNAFFDGYNTPIELLKGKYLTQSGLFSYVINEYGKGAVIKLEDGSLWDVPQYDQYDTGWWLPPYPVLITSNELYMINLKKGKKVWVSRAR
jgi:hypothetical protein|tara:strand:+ start:148 stop:726 length:579 start_codon:yes stop_codon:yes gene_type:complete